MSIVFAGVLKLRDGTDRDMFSRKMMETALHFGYGLRFEPRQFNVQWAAEAVEKLGGGAMFFEAVSEPFNINADAIYCVELWEPLDWSKVQFPTFLLRLWQLPELEAALFVRYDDNMDNLDKEDGLPPPMSIYKAMEGVVSNWDGTAREFYLDKKSPEPVWRGE